MSRRLRWRAVSQRPLAIAFFAQDFPPSVGGTHVYNHELSRRLHERGHRVRVFTWADGRSRHGGIGCRAAVSGPPPGLRAAGPRHRRRWRRPVRRSAGGPTSRSCRAARGRSPGWFAAWRLGCPPWSRCTTCATRVGAAGDLGAGACAGATASTARRGLPPTASTPGAACSSWESPPRSWRSSTRESTRSKFCRIELAGERARKALGLEGASCCSPSRGWRRTRDTCACSRRCPRCDGAFRGSCT